MSDFDKDECTFCGAEIMRIDRGMCSKCSGTVFRREDVRAPAEELGSVLHDNFDWLYHLIRFQGKRINKLERDLKELRGGK